jgi:hypothetical protein
MKFWQRSIVPNDSVKYLGSIATAHFFSFLQLSAMEALCWFMITVQISFAGRMLAAERLGRPFKG